MKQYRVFITDQYGNTHTFVNENVDYIRATKEAKSKFLQDNPGLYVKRMSYNCRTVA